MLEFITFLHIRYQYCTSITPEKTAFCSEPFVGMWKDREEMQDSTAYVKKLRHQEWEKNL